MNRLVTSGSLLPAAVFIPNGSERYLVSPELNLPSLLLLLVAILALVLGFLWVYDAIAKRERRVGIRPDKLARPRVTKSRV